MLLVTCEFFFSYQKGLLIRESVSALNMNIVDQLAEAFLMHPGDIIQWLNTSCQNAPLSKTLFYLLLMQSLHKMNSSSGKVLSMVYALAIYLDDSGVSISKGRKSFVSFDKLARVYTDGCVFL